MKLKLNVKKLVEACGGPTKVAKTIGRSRTAPYSWLKNGCVTSRTLELIKQHYPELNIDEFFDLS